MQEYTRIEHPMEIKRPGTTCYAVPHRVYITGRSPRIDDALRTVKLPIVLVPGLKRNLFPSSAAEKKEALQQS